MVMATQNPLENYGTFPLPEAQIDRFFMKLKLGYMNREEELSVIRRPSSSQIVETLECVVSLEAIEQLKQMIPQIQMSDEVADYLMEIVTRTRTDSRFTLGVSTRGAIALYKASQVTAALSGRDYVLPEDVRYVTPYVLGHRIASDGPVSYTHLSRLEPRFKALYLTSADDPGGGAQLYGQNSRRNCRCCPADRSRGAAGRHL